MSATLFTRRPTFPPGPKPVLVGKTRYGVPAHALVAHGENNDQRVAWIAYSGADGIELRCLVEAGEVAYPPELKSSVLAQKFGIAPTQ